MFFKQESNESASPLNTTLLCCCFSSQGHHDPGTAGPRAGEQVHHGPVHSVRHHLQDQSVLCLRVVLQVRAHRPLRHLLQVGTDVQLGAHGKVREVGKDGENRQVGRVQVWVQVRVGVGVRVRSVLQVERINCVGGVEEQRQQPDGVVSFGQFTERNVTIPEKFIYLMRVE